jgi:hypothetical protein
MCVTGSARKYKRESHSVTVCLSARQDKLNNQSNSCVIYIEVRLGLSPHKMRLGVYDDDAQFARCSFCSKVLIHEKGKQSSVYDV